MTELVRDPDLNSQNKKALVVTLIDPVGNYGNILQHYALKEAVQSLGYDVESLDCPIRELGFCRKVCIFMLRKLKQAAKLVLAVAGVKKYREQLRRKFTSKTGRRNWNKGNTERKAIFQEFYRDYVGKIIHSTYSKTLRNSPEEWSRYKYVITGSDQVWSIGLVKTFHALRYYYLQFVESEKRVNYAPSFGVSRLKFYERHVHRKGLEGFETLSCREEEGCEIIRELTGRDAQLVLDPTLLLTAEQWLKIARKPQYDVPEHYAVVYFMGNDDIKQEAIRIAGALPVLDVWDCSGAYHYSSMTGPREFVWLVEHADCVLTSSFHGTAFSVNFGKKFISFNTNNKFSRIRTLLSNVELMHRVYEPGRNILDDPIDYELVKAKLDSLRAASMAYLKDCLK